MADSDNIQEQTSQTKKVMTWPGVAAELIDRIGKTTANKIATLLAAGVFLCLFATAYCIVRYQAFPSFSASARPQDPKVTALADKLVKENPKLALFNWTIEKDESGYHIRTADAVPSDLATEGDTSVPRYKVLIGAVTGEDERLPRFAAKEEAEKFAEENRGPQQPLSVVVAQRIVKEKPTEN